MFFANAVYTSNEFGPCHIAIGTEETTEQFWEKVADKSLPHLHYKEPIAQAIMKAAAKEVVPISFECNGVKYSLEKYTRNSLEKDYNPFRRISAAYKVSIETHEEIYVYSERCRCTACYEEYGFDSIESICGFVRLKHRPTKAVLIDIQYCKHCRKYFIDAQSLYIYENMYGLLDITKRSITENETYQLRDSYTYSEDTVLSRNGYSTQLYKNQRQRILSNIIDTGISSKAEIKDILSRFIRQRGNRFPKAKAVWSDDLNYVNQYNLEKERGIKFL